MEVDRRGIQLCACGLQSEKQWQKSSSFMVNGDLSGFLEAMLEKVWGLVDYNGHVKKQIDGFKDAHEENNLVKEMWEKFC